MHVDALRKLYVPGFVAVTEVDEEGSIEDLLWTRVVILPGVTRPALLTQQVLRRALYSRNKGEYATIFISEAPKRSMTAHSVEYGNRPSSTRKLQLMCHHRCRRVGMPTHETTAQALRDGFQNTMVRLKDPNRFRFRYFS